MPVSKPVALPTHAIAALQLRRLWPTEEVYRLVFSPNGRVLHVSFKGGVATFDAETGLPRGGRMPEHPAGQPPWTSPDGELVVRLELTSPSFEVERTDTSEVIWRDDEWHHRGGPVVAFPGNGRFVAFLRQSRRRYDMDVRVIDAHTGELLHELRGLESPVVALEKSGLLAAIRTKPCAVVLIDAARGRVVRALPFHSRIERFAVSPDERLLAVACRNVGLRLLDVETGTDAVVPSRPIERLVLSPDGRWLAAHRSDRTVQLWDRAAGDLIGRLAPDLEPIHGLAFAPGGGEVAVVHAKQILRLDPATWEEVAPPIRHPAPNHHGLPDVRGLAYLSPELLALAGASGVELVDFVQGRVIRRIKHPEVTETTGGYTSLFEGESSTWTAPAEILALSVARASALLATAGADRVRLWEVGSRKEVAALPEARRVALSPDGQRIALADRERLQILELGGTPRPAAFGRAPSQGSVHVGPRLGPLAWSPDGARVAVCTNKHVRLFDAVTGVAAGRLAGHKAAVTAAVWSPDGRTLITGDEQGVVYEWDPARDG